MRAIFLTIICSCLLTTALSSVGSSGTLSLPVANNFSVVLPDDSWHQTPLLEFLRDLDRVVRQTARFDNNSSHHPLILLLSREQPPGSSKFVYLRQYRNHVLQVPLNYHNWLAQPAVGRAVTMALLQSRLGNAPHDPLPEEAWWIADGLWAEFVQRRKQGSRILRFVDLPALRSIAEKNGKIKIDQSHFSSPPPPRPGSVEWTLYCERAQLMLELQKNLSGRNEDNALKDYCFLLFGKQLTAQECFQQTFAARAQKKLSSSRQIKTSDEPALDILALQKIFSVYLPASPQMLKHKFREIIQVKYLHPNGNFEMTAALSDLPFLVEKYESCVTLPRRKIILLSRLTAIAPADLRNDIMQINNALADIGRSPAYRVASEIKNAVLQIDRKLNYLQHIDTILNRYEQAQIPLLYEYRFAIEAVRNRSLLPLKIKEFIDAAEFSLRK